MEKLPVEILENILKNSQLKIKDVVNVALTNRHFYVIVVNNRAIWKQKFKELYPFCGHAFSSDYEYLQEIHYIYTLKKETRKLLETMPGRFYKQYELSDDDLEEWGLKLYQRTHAYDYIVSFLMELVNNNTSINSIEVVPLNTPGNKTMQYYARKVLRYLQQKHLTDFWQEFLSWPSSRQILERGAVFVAQWCQPNIPVHYEAIARDLDEMANLVKKRLRLTNPDHELFRATKADFARWKVENLETNQWSVASCRELITAMREVIYVELEFTGNSIAYYMTQNSLINEVLNTRRGLPITLAVIYEAVGRRLGLRLEPISFPAHFLLRFTENAGPDAAWYYIDIFNGGNIVRKSACPHSRLKGPKGLFPVATAEQVVERMANNLELSARQHPQPNGRITRLRSVLELLKLVSPQDLSSLVNLARLYMLHNMNTRSLEYYLTNQRFNAAEQAQRIVHMLRDYAGHHERNESEQGNHVEVAQRTENLKYAVGMVMEHTFLGYKCIIYDWDPMCLASAEWQFEMNVNKLTFKNEQPFYNVLADDGSYRYVAQENLLPTSNIGYLELNEDLGRHFSHYFENHYVPNAEKEKEYPGDKKVRHKFYHDMQSG